MAARLVGRSAETATLTRALEGTAAGHGGLAVVFGEAGVGKTRLAAEVAAAAGDRGMAVLVGRAVDGGAPLGPVAEAFLAAFRDRPPPADLDLDPFRAALGPLVPEWQPSVPPPPPPPLVRREAILRLLRAVGGTSGCVLVVEDLHWADPETLGTVEHLAEHARGQRILCVATVRTGEGTPGLALARSLGARGAALAVELGRLDDGEVAELARSVADEALDADAVRVLCERAEGLPLLVEDLVATARTTGAPLSGVLPASFAESVGQRLAAIGEPAGTVVAAAAVLGRRFDWRLLGPVAGVDEAVVAGAVRAAAAAQLVEGLDGSACAFRHALTRDAVLGRLLPPERAALSGRALDAVVEGHPGLPGEWCELAARLAVEAGRPAEAVALLCEAARRALVAGSLDAAEATAARARVVAEDAGDDAGAIAAAALVVEVASLAGRTDVALEVGGALLARQDPAGAAGTHLRLARAAAAAGRWEVARRHLDDARRAAPAGSALASQADAVAAGVAMEEGRVDEAVALARRALAAGGGPVPPEVVCEAHEVLGRAVRPRDLDGAEGHFSAAEEAARAAGLRLWEIRALHELGTIDMLRFDGLERLERARELAASGGVVAVAAVVDLQLASSYALLFQPEAALAAVARGLEMARLTDLGPTRTMLVAQGALAHATAGRRPEMEEALSEALALAGDHPDPHVVAWGHCRTLAALLDEDRPAALGALREALAWSQRPGVGIVGAFGGWLALVGTVEGGEHDGLREVARGLRGMGIAINRALLGYADAVALGRAGREEEATALAAAMDAVLEAARGADAWRHLGRRLAAEGAVADGWGDPVAWLREALPWFEEQGHVRVVAACRALLARAGAPVPRRGRGTTPVPAGLRAAGVTSREADVLRLVAAGMGNAEIARQLFLSPRTVEKHVERLRDKTAAASRSELAALAAKYGVAGS